MRFGQTRQDPETRIRAHFKQGGVRGLISTLFGEHGADHTQITRIMR